MHVDTWLYFSPLLKRGPFLRPKSLSTDWLMISLPEITESLACSAASSAGCLAVRSEDTLECELKRPGDVTSPQSFIQRNVWATNKGLISDNIDRLFHAENRTQFPVRTGPIHLHGGCEVNTQPCWGSCGDGTGLQAASLPSGASSSQEKRDEGPGGNDAADPARQGPGSAAWPARRPRPCPAGERLVWPSPPLPPHLRSPGCYVLPVLLWCPHSLEARMALGCRGHLPWWLTLEEERQMDC